MGSVNLVVLVGNLGKDAELRYTAGGAAVASFSLATSDTWTDKAGNKQSRTEWHRVIVWGKTAEALAEYLVKGKAIYVQGKLQTRKWTDKDGATKYTTEVTSDRIVLLGPAPQVDRTRHVRDEDVGHGEPTTTDPALASQLSDDDIPF